MSVTVYRSDDASAPVLTAAAGDLIALLDACLVNGYGAKAAAGWGKPYNDTNKAVYRAASGNRHYLYIDDSPTQYSLARGYRAMTAAADTGTGAFPTVAQLAGGIRPIKSNGTDATARPWIVIADARAFYVWVAYAVTDIGAPSTSTDVWLFGEIISYLPSDAMHTILIGRQAATAAASTTSLANALIDTGADIPGHYLASSYLQDGNGYPCGCLQTAQAANASAGTSGPTYPDPITGSLLLDYLRICEGGSSAKLVRGHLPGIFNPIHPLPGNHLDTLAGRGALAGKDLLLLYKGGTAGRLAFSLDSADWVTPT
ncbi:hypothetical protein [Thiocystis violascens]|uniref:Uncharacterized protein n=1 Tax=Thiocystis violascens (strain ATCC 17096 / DSM 198 / 6111) TaxID=765911 RepID=I3Y8P1_THIV6|nr:hypothetical protein [Thiocystis violascens]AFL73359.1 hypothetical protein Thivi_1346 [Thiocystis violascens DSM 198]